MKRQLFALFLILCLLAGCAIPSEQPSADSSVQTAVSSAVSEGTLITLSNLPAYSGSPYVELNGNQPDFSQDLYQTESYEFYTSLDQLGRCGACYADIGPDLMPTEDRESISSVHPSGWMQAQYDCVDGGNLYNRCHLIGFQLTGENANDCNLITGTRYLNVEGMLPFENQVADYIRETGNHVLYRATPDFQGENLVASGVELEAASVEDDTISFHVYCYNVQPGVVINYATGESHLEETAQDSTQDSPQEETVQYILNTSNHKFHLPDCSSVSDMNPENREEYTGTREALVAEGYSPCGRCKP